MDAWEVRVEMRITKTGRLLTASVLLLGALAACSSFGLGGGLGDGERGSSDWQPSSNQQSAAEPDATSTADKDKICEAARRRLQDKGAESSGPCQVLHEEGILTGGRDTCIGDHLVEVSRSMHCCPVRHTWYGSEYSLNSLKCEFQREGRRQRP